MMRGETLFQWTIYLNPRDYPGKYVVRRWSITRGAVLPDPEPVAVVDTLQEARAAVPLGYYCMPRLTDDDPTIEEVWL